MGFDFNDDEMDERTLLEKVEKFQMALICNATGDSRMDEETFSRLRQELLSDPTISSRLPDFVRRHRNNDQFWQFIKARYRTYLERRKYIWGGFRPTLDYLEAQATGVGVAPMTEALEAFDPEHVSAIWQKALDRRLVDPDGAITAARTLLETVCKHILDDAGEAYSEKADLPKLWALTATLLNLAPHQHQEDAFKTILGNCQSVVNGLGSIRNKIGDAHGQGRRPIKPKPRHAELAVNLAGTMASFLVTTWKEKAST
ncbi:abortive infection family protein [Gluconobacter morbifer]|uniref:Abortive infection protein-like C-terminal domain-containing protein n=1 Tax=Gluconobacter morbifer G707 TaxID=1088869 RepID=G6XKB4_9PROT|nr:abortive infection family protein [Gluconobacter morbifer]EHH67710.1 hypothetical protein GMO_19300 [Gluconobacter morbifer G707]